MAARSGKFGPLLALFLVLAGLGGYNYHRNFQAEKAAQGEQPFASYDEASLAALATAYASDVAGLQKEYEALRGQRTTARPTRGVRAGVQEFERVQAGTRRLREVTEELATSEAREREIRAEQEYRQRLGSGVVIHLERLTGLSIPL